MGGFATFILAALVRCGDCRAGIYPAAMGPDYAWQKLERHAAHDQGAGTCYKRTLSIHPASDLYSIHPDSGIDAFDLSQLAHWSGMDRYDRSRNHIKN